MKKLTKNALRSLIVGSALAFVAVISPLAAPATYAADCNSAPSLESGVACANPGDQVPDTLFGQGSIFTIIVNILLFVIGAISVIMLIVGGIRYTVSAGDASAVTGAKNTIMYAIVGLVVAFLAFAVVNWVLTSLTA
jgi:uncharacterized membrane protein